jgi:hypothetical protein
MRSVLAGLFIGASGLILVAAPAAGQQEAAPLGGIQRADPTVAIGIDGILLPQVPAASDKDLAALSEQASAELLTWDRVYVLAVVRARSGGAVAESLDPQALVEQSRRYGAADFARFRKDFLAGRTETGGAFQDPSAGYFGILRRLRAIDDVRQHVAALENLLKLVQELVQGGGSGLSQLDVDLLTDALVQGRRREAREVAGYRDALDELKVELGLSPHAAVIPDRRILAGFRDARKAIDVWARRPNRQHAMLPRIVEHLPALGDAVVNGQPILRAIEQAPNRMEDLLREAARLAIENRGGADKARPPGDRDPALELRVRRRVRHLLEMRRDYADQKRVYVLAIRLRDQAFERLVNPPSGVSHPLLTPVVQGLVDDVTRLLATEDRLATIWASFRTERLALYRDLGVLPYDNWDAFYDDLSAGHGAAEEASAAAPAGPAPAAPVPPAPAQPVAPPSRP